MNMPQLHTPFQSLNKGYNKVFKANRMSLGLVVPIETYVDGPIPSMVEHVQRVQWAEKLGFYAVWVRDVPFNVPSFGDAGQLYDPFVYLGYLAAQTQDIALGVASIVLPLRHPAHVAKSAASIDALSHGRLILGVASGDRPQEYPAMNMGYSDRGARFREGFEYIRKVHQSNPIFHNGYGSFSGDMDMLPKPCTGKVPMLITGSSQQSDPWIAQNGDGWMVYPHQLDTQKRIIADWNGRVKKAGRGAQPVMQPLYIDLDLSRNDKPHPIHLGFKSGTGYLLEYLKRLEEIGINHVALNLRFNRCSTQSALNALAEKVLPAFSD